MTRIYRHTIADAPEASRPLLEGILPFSPTGKLLNMHAQMAHSPAVLAAYASIRQATATYGTLDPRVRSALMLATASVSHSAYAQAVTSFLADRAGWSRAEVLALREGRPLGEAFALVALTVFTAWFTSYAQTPMDLPAGPAAADEPE